MASGVNAYIIKPFTFAGMRAKLEQYAAWRSALADVHDDVVQAEVDRLFDLRRGGATPGALPRACRTRPWPRSRRACGSRTDPGQHHRGRRGHVPRDGPSVSRAPRDAGGGVAPGPARGAGRPEVLYRWGRTAGRMAFAPAERADLRRPPRGGSVMTTLCEAGRPPTWWRTSGPGRTTWCAPGIAVPALAGVTEARSRRAGAVGLHRAGRAGPPGAATRVGVRAARRR